MKNTLFSIIIPAYNEAERISPTLFSIDAYMRTKDYSYEILVVNDGSRDSTARVVSGLSTSIKNLRLIDNTENHGKGWVVRQGMLAAQGEYRLFMDADNSTSIENIDAFLKEAQKGNDIVISSRRIKGAVLAKPQGFVRDVLGWTFRKIVHAIVPLGIIDTQNGFKLFSKTAVEHVFNKQQTFAWAFDVEVLAIAHMYNLTIKEVPVTYVDDERTHMTFKGMVGMLQQVIQIKINILKGKYGLYSKALGDPRYVTLTKFIIFGFVNTIIDWSWYLALSRSFPLFSEHVVFAKGIAFLIASIPVLVGNVYWVFPKKSFRVSDQIKLYSILATAFIINVASVSVLIAHGMPDISAVVLATLISFVWNLGIAWTLLIKDQVFVVPASLQQSL